MEENRFKSFCEELYSLIKHGPGKNPEGTARVGAIIREILYDRNCDPYVREKAKAVIGGFDVWFSARKWNASRDGGERAKGHVYADVAKLEHTVDIITGERATRG